MYGVRIATRSTPRACRRAHQRAGAADHRRVEAGFGDDLGEPALRFDVRARPAGHERDEAGVDDGVDAGVGQLGAAAVELADHRVQRLRVDGAQHRAARVEREGRILDAPEHLRHLGLDGRVRARHDEADASGGGHGDASCSSMRSSASASSGAARARARSSRMRSCIQRSFARPASGAAHALRHPTGRHGPERLQVGQRVGRLEQVRVAVAAELVAQDEPADLRAERRHRPRRPRPATSPPRRRSAGSGRRGSPGRPSAPPALSSRGPPA